jgi:hypothetical protein
MRILVLNSKDRGGGAAAVAPRIAAGYVAAGPEVGGIVGHHPDPTAHSVTEVRPLVA